MGLETGLFPSATPNQKRRWQAGKGEMFQELHPELVRVCTKLLLFQELLVLKVNKDEFESNTDIILVETFSRRLFGHFQRQSTD